MSLPVLLDHDTRARLRLLGPGGELPTVLVVDRYAAAWDSYPAPGHRLPPTGEIVASVRHAELTCADCAAPGWGG